MIVPEGVDDQPVFCCVGCQSVYGAIREWGFGGYYKLRETEGEAARPAAPDERQLERLDEPAFLRRHTEQLAGGQRRRAEFFLEGVHCSGCVWIVEQMPDHLEGVRRARLNLGRSRLTLEWAPDKLDLSEVGCWLAKFGYGLHPLTGEHREDRDAEQKLLRRTGVAWAIAANVMLLAVALYAGLNRTDSPFLYHGFRVVSLILTTLAVVYPGAVFFRRAWASISGFVSQDWREWRLDQLSIDLPIAIGITAGYLQSTVATISGSGEIWFDSLSVLIAALLTARWLQVRSRRAAGDAAERLRAVLPWSARRVDEGEENGATEMIDLEELKQGDIVEVRTGEVVPADGRLQSSVGSEGIARLQRAVLTGESRPEAVRPGERVHAGVRNAGEALRMRVDRRPDESRIGRLMDWIDERGTGAPVVEWTDRIAGAFVVTVLIGAAATLVGWSWAGSSHAVQYAVALLVVACPCALGIATPLALTTGVGRAAARGLFIKRDTAFQQVDTLDVAVFDKTGTLTRGDMAVETIVYPPDWMGDEVELFEQIAALESDAGHPVATALCREYRRMIAHSPEHTGDITDEFAVALESVDEIAGEGIRGEVGGTGLLIGRPAWVWQATGDCEPAPEWFERAVSKAGGAGDTPVAVARDGQLVALCAIGDPIRDEAKGVIDELMNDGIECRLVSGDHTDVVEHVGDHLGIRADLRAGDVSPEKKRKEIIEIIERGKAVAMVGDGVNDAAALKAASVGVAVGESAQASLDAADVFATRGGVTPVVDLVDGAREVMRVIRRNLGMSILYNTAGISLAAAGWVTPLVAAVAMPVSSIAVVISSVLQSSFHRRSQSQRPQPAVVGTL